MLELGGRASAIVLKLQKRSWWPRREQPPQVTLPGEAAPGLEPALCLLGGDSASLRGLESQLCGSRAAEAGLGPASSPGSAGEGVPVVRQVEPGPGAGQATSPPSPGCETLSGSSLLEPLRCSEHLLAAMVYFVTLGQLLL